MALAPDVGPTYPDAVIAARAEVLDLVDRLGMNPIGGPRLLLWALIHFEELHTATSDDVAPAGDAPGFRTAGLRVPASRLTARACEGSGADTA